MTDEIDFGHLAGLIGNWKGDKGTDIAPEPDGEENSPYYETICFSPVGLVGNADEQELAAIHYHQIVYRKSNDEEFHNETGYWMWDRATGVIMHSLAIPRAVCVLAGGIWNGEIDDQGRVVLEVAAAEDNPDWNIVQSPFMAEKARTVSFTHKLIVGGDTLSYDETTMVDIYGKLFEHTDANELSSA